MNIKLVNCFQELSEFKNHEKTIKILGEKLSKRDLSGIDFNRIRKEFKSAKDALKLSCENIIGTIPYIKVENEEDYKALKELVSYVTSSEEVKLSNSQKTDLVKDLYSLDVKDFKDDFQSYVQDLFKDETIFSLGGEMSSEVLIANLHDEFNSGKQNPLLEKFFSQYYLVSEFIAKNDRGDFGKKFVNSIIADKQVPSHYKKALRKIYQEYRMDKTFVEADPYKNFRSIKMSHNALGIRKVVQLPLKAVGGIVKLTGKAVSLVSNLAATPFKSLAKLAFKSENKAAQVAGAIVDLPGTILKTVGGAVNYTTSLISAGIDKINNVLTMPLKMLSDSLDMEAGLPAEGYINKEDKHYRTNLFKALKTIYPNVKKSKFEPFQYDIDENNVLDIKVLHEKESYDIKYQIDELTAKKLKIFQEDFQKLGNASVEDVEAAPEEYCRKIKAPYLERRYLANITSQKPIEIVYNAKEKSDALTLLGELLKKTFGDCVIIQGTAEDVDEQDCDNEQDK